MDCSNNNQLWDWKIAEYSNRKGSNTEMSGGLWNEEDMSCFFHELTTPITACGDLAYHVTQSDTRNKDSVERWETGSQVKRRRMLQFSTTDFASCSEDMSSVFRKSNETDGSVEETFPEVSQWVSGFSEDASVSASSHDGVEQSSDRWFAECINDTEMTFSPDDMNFSSDVQIDVSEFFPPEQEPNPVQQQSANRITKSIVIKGRRSYIRPPTKFASSITYPFTFIKPCGVHGDVTLKDINQKIRTPPPSTSKQGNDDLAGAFPTSAFSGKPVVGKTKIQTEGGKGSITIMRTKG